MDAEEKGEYSLKRLLTFIILFLIVLSSISCTKVNLSKTTPKTLSSQPDGPLKLNEAEGTTGNILTAPDNPTEEPSMLTMIKDAENYPATYPKFSVTSNNINIPWIRSDANYTGKPGGRVGNTAFGADEYIADQALKATDLKPGSIVRLDAEEVSGLDKPECKVSIFDKTKKSDQLVLYPSTQSQLIAPKEAGKYLFLCDVNWGKGDNEITYWFKINISAN